MNLFDSHCHLYDEPNPEKIIEDAALNGVTGFIIVGTSLTTSKKTLEVASELKNKFQELDIGCSVGLHPHDAKDSLDGFVNLLELAKNEYPELLVAIGECGLDYYYNLSPKEVQKSVFKSQIELAKQFGLTLVVHTRDAWEDTFEILDQCISDSGPHDSSLNGSSLNGSSLNGSSLNGSSLNGFSVVIHCFTGGPTELEECIRRNFVVSFSGIVTFKKSIELQQAAQACPLDKLLIETDSPFLAPEPYRGKPNQPKNVTEVAKKIAVLKNITTDEIASSTYETTVATFKIS